MKVKERPFAEGSRDYPCASAFILKAIRVLKIFILRGATYVNGSDK
jgi:hypothetical protein